MSASKARTSKKIALQSIIAPALSQASSLKASSMSGCGRLHLAGLQVAGGFVDDVIQRVGLVLEEHELNQAHDQHEEHGREQRELDHHVAARARL